MDTPISYVCILAGLIGVQFFFALVRIGMS